MWSTMVFRCYYTNNGIHMLNKKKMLKQQKKVEAGWASQGRENCTTDTKEEEINPFFARGFWVINKLLYLQRAN